MKTPFSHNVRLIVSETSTVQNMLDDLYFTMQDHVGIYTYLTRWILKHQRTGVQLIMTEIAEYVPAATVFLPGSRWKVELLEEPYSRSETNPRTIDDNSDNKALDR